MTAIALSADLNGVTVEIALLDEGVNAAVVAIVIGTVAEAVSCA